MPKPRRGARSRVRAAPRSRARTFAPCTGSPTRRPAATSQALRPLPRLATRATADDAGAWRTKTMPPLAGGTVPPPHWLVPFETETDVRGPAPRGRGPPPPPPWLVPFETETYVGRLALGADDPAPLAIALAIARLVRLQPFPHANGR